MSEEHGVAWYGLGNATELWQPVDAGVAQTMKQLVGQEHREWLDFDDNADRWFGHENTFSAMERRTLLTYWSGGAWTKFNTDGKYAQVIYNAFERTGCLPTVDGSRDHHGLLNHVVPPTSILEPADDLPKSNEGSGGSEDIQIKIADIDVHEIEFFDLINNQNNQHDTEIIEKAVIFT